MNEKEPEEAERGSALRISSPSKKVAKSDVVTPRSSLIRKSVRMDRGDGGPPSNVKCWENCVTQERRKCSTAISDTLVMHVRPRPVGLYECGVLNLLQ